MKRIAIPVCLLICAGLVTSTMMALDYGSATPGTVELCFIATGFSQCALLAIWGNLARLPRWKRVLGLVCGTIYLGLLVMFAMGEWNKLRDWCISFTLAACPVSLLTAVLALARKRPPEVELVHKSTVAHASTSPQFTLRHIMAMVFAVAIALTAGRVLRATQMPEVLEVATVCIVLAMCVTGATAAALWAALASGRPPGRITLAMGLALLTGLIPPFYFEMEQHDYLLTSLAAFGAQALTIATLLFARANGYRLVRRLAPQVDSEEPSELVAHPLD